MLRRWSRTLALVAHPIPVELWQDLKSCWTSPAGCTSSALKLDFSDIHHMILQMDNEVSGVKATADKSKTMPRDADMTRKRILSAATAEFARKGLGGARVDEIALRSKSNKRMIYHYFGSKEQLFTAVLEAAYLGIRTAEKELHLDELDPESAILSSLSSPGNITSNTRNCSLLSTARTCIAPGI